MTMVLQQVPATLYLALTVTLLEHASGIALRACGRPPGPAPGSTERCGRLR